MFLILMGLAQAAQSDANALSTAVGLPLIDAVEYPASLGSSTINVELVTLGNGLRTELVAVSLSHTCAATAPGCFAGRPALFRQRFDRSVNGLEATIQWWGRSATWGWASLATVTEDLSISNGFGQLTRVAHSPSNLLLGTQTLTAAHSTYPTGPRAPGTVWWSEGLIAVPAPNAVGTPSTTVGEDWTWEDCLSTINQLHDAEQQRSAQLAVLAEELDRLGLLSPEIEALIQAGYELIADRISDITAWGEDCYDAVPPMGPPEPPEVVWIDPDDFGLGKVVCQVCTATTVQTYDVSIPSENYSDGYFDVQYEEEVCKKWSLKLGTDADSDGICD